MDVQSALTRYQAIYQASLSPQARRHVQREAELNSIKSIRRAEASRHLIPSRTVPLLFFVIELC